MKTLKKIGAIVIVVMMVLGMSTTVLADGQSLTMHDATELTTINEVVRILKEITVYNTASATVNEPTASYTYGISAGSANKLVTDANSNTAYTKAGVFTGTGVSMTTQTNSTAAVTTSSTAATTTLTYAPENTNGASGAAEQLNATAAGTANTKWIDIDFSGVVFGAPGIYRYVITESGYTYGSNGVIEGDTGHARYLDVYVKQNSTFNNGTTAAEWDVYGYALLTTDDQPVGTSSGNNEATLYKTTGFTSDSSNSKEADAYYTFNVTVNKTLVNDDMQKTHDFEFLFDFANTTVIAATLPVVTGSGATNGSYTGTFASPTAQDYTTNGWASATNLNSVLYAAKFGDGDSVTFTGLPAGTTVTVKEYNDVTGTTYTVETSGATSNLAAASVAWENWSGTADATVAAKTDATANMSSDSNITIDFTNTLTQISPTGYAARFAPYALMLAAGVVIFILSRRRKSNKEDA